MTDEGIRNRILLWFNAVHEAQELLVVAKRARDFKFPAGQMELFPNPAECHQIERACKELASVYFCQLYNIGYSDSTAVGNSQKFQDEHREKILAVTFDTIDSRKAYDVFIIKVRRLRDEMVGHADAKAFEIRQRPGVTLMNSASKMTDEIDLDYWLSFIDKFRRQILNYRSILKASRDNGDP